MADDKSAIQAAVIFLRMAANELRQIATLESAPGLVAQLRHIADQCETEATELENGGGTPQPAVISN